MRALAFHQCGLGSIPGSDVICGSSLLVLYSAPRGFSPGTPVFSSHQIPTFDLIWLRSAKYTWDINKVIIIIIIIIIIIAIIIIIIIRKDFFKTLIAQIISIGGIA